MAILSLPPAERFCQENILLPVVSRAAVYKKYGMGRVLCGVDEDGTRHPDEINYSTDMQEADQGRWISIPDDVNGGSMSVRLRVWQIAVCADMLGYNSLGPFQESLHAHVFCRQCNVNQSLPGAFRPYSFMRADTPGTYVPKRRTWPELQAVLERCRSPSTPAAERKRIMAAEGIKRLWFAMDPDFVPHVNPAEDHLQDGLHLFGDGLLRSHAAWMFQVLLRRGLSLDAVNVAKRAYRGFPKDVRVPDLQPGLTRGCAGVKGVLPRAESTLRMPGSEVHHFALHR